MELILFSEPTIKTINHENITTIIVRSAVAKLESVLFIPILAKIAVIPANRAAPKAYKIHTFIPPLTPKKS